MADSKALNAACLRRRCAWPGLLTLLSAISGMAYSLWWPAVVRHNSRYWITPGDLWSTVHAAHYVGWGGLSFVYSSRAVFVTLPGFATLLSPVVVLGSHLGLTESAPGIFLPKPEIWLLIGPVCLLLAGTSLFGLDAVAIRLGLSTTSRRGLLVAEAIALWPTTAIWGHPEDAIAVGLLAFAFVAAMDGRWALTAWLLGAAIAMQLHAVLVVPIFLGVAGARKAAPLMARASILPGFFAVAVLVPNFHRSLSVLLNQPTFPASTTPLRGLLWRRAWATTWSRLAHRGSLYWPLPLVRGGWRAGGGTTPRGCSSQPLSSSHAVHLRVGHGSLLRDACRVSRHPCFVPR